jgi:hypothetical protein
MGSWLKAIDGRKQMRTVGAVLFGLDAILGVYMDIR